MYNFGKREDYSLYKRVIKKIGEQFIFKKICKF